MFILTNDLVGKQVLVKLSITVIVLYFIINLNVHALENSESVFYQNFKINRSEQGQLSSIQIKKDGKITIIEYVNFLKKLLKVHFENSKRNIDTKTIEFLDISELQQARKLNSSKYINNGMINVNSVMNDSFENLKNIDFDKILSDPMFVKLVNEFEIQFGEWTTFYSIIAKPNDPDYFFKETLKEKFLDHFRSIISSILDSIPGANFAEWILNQVMQLQESRQIYYQNLLLEILNSKSLVEDGISETEQKEIISSIFESRIKWWKQHERMNARENWTEYGQFKFDLLKEKIDKKIAKQSSQFGEFIDKVAHSFFLFNKNDNLIIINGINKKNWIQSELSMAFSLSQQNEIYSQRSDYLLFSLGLRFLPIFGPIKSLLEKYNNSKYIGQVRSEGALMASQLYSEDNFILQLAKQSMSPIIERDFAN